MTNSTEIQIEKIAKYSYENGRLATDTTPWDEISKDTRASYINEAKEQYEYLIDMLSVLGAPPANVERLTKNLSINMEHSAKVMQENAELKTKLDQRNESIRDLKEKLKSHLNHTDEGVDNNEALINLQKKYNLLQDSFGIMSDEATASADMVEKLIPLQNENKLLKKERDALEYKLNTAVESTKIISETDTEPDKTKTQPINKEDALDTPPSEQKLSEKEHITYVYDLLNKSNSLKDGKIALCKALKIEPKNLRSETKLWISIRIKQCGWDAVNKACNTINQA